MSDAIILDGVNHVTDLSSAEDFQKKHTPFVKAEPVEGGTRLTVHVGHYVAHPNQPDHFIQWIELQVNGVTIARFDLSPVAVSPEVSTVVTLDAGTVVRAVEFCNLHGVWAAEITL